MSASATLTRRSRKARRTAPLPHGRGSVHAGRARQMDTALLAGCDESTAAQLERLCARLELSTTRAGTFDAAVDHLQRQTFALWVLDARKLPLAEPILWASLRFAGERPRGARLPPAAGSVPVLVLIAANDRKALSTLSAAAAAPTITGWNRSGWRLGVQEMPCADERLEALLRNLLTEAWVNEAPLKKPA